MPSISLLDPNLLLNELYCALFCVEGLQECLTAAISLQLYWWR
jgi:hypothetical protein